MTDPGALPMVSVCIQTYQHEDYIKECLDSVLSQQTNFPFEIILGEDDSTDKTREICSAYAEKYPGIIRLFLRSAKDKIFINGRKTGRFNFISNLQAARGKYIALLDGDDYWTDPQKLQKQFGYMESHPGCSICFHRILLRLEPHRIIKPSKPKLPTTSAHLTWHDLVKENMINSNSSFFLRSNLDDIPDWFWQTPFLDYPIHIEGARKGYIGFLNDTMAVYRIHKKGMWTSLKELDKHRQFWEFFTMLGDIYNDELRDAILERRNIEGKLIIRYFKKHLWEKKDWFRDELAKNKFPQDAGLLRLTTKAPGILDYLRSGWNYTKKQLW